MAALTQGEDGFWRTSAEGAVDESAYRLCANYTEQDVCNWAVPGATSAALCESCRLTSTIPNLAAAGNREAWAKLETAKRRLVYALLNLALPLRDKLQEPERGVEFRFLNDAINGYGDRSRVLTGHDNGVITINVAESDDVYREHQRLSHHEPYRTLLGHFRHEIGHYYWDRLIRDTKYLEPFRAMFGDERADYDTALKTYYASGPPDDWQEKFISVYASAHPWEDWAETWAHYLHIQDTLEVALEFSLVDRQVALESKSTPLQSWFGLREKSFEEKIEAWSELTIALNSINRSMGLRDVYPFVLSDAVVAKLRFISEVIGDRAVTAKFPPIPQTPPEPAGPNADSQKPLESNLAPAVSQPDGAVQD